MADVKIGKSYLARKQLFQKGLKSGRLTVQEIEEALPAGTLTAAHVASVDSLVVAWRGQGPVSLPGGLEAVRAYGRLTVR